jgi:hypothetical protein
LPPAASPDPFAFVWGGAQPPSAAAPLPPSDIVESPPPVNYDPAGAPELGAWDRYWKPAVHAVGQTVMLPFTTPAAILQKATEAIQGTPADQSQVHLNFDPAAGPIGLETPGIESIVTREAFQRPAAAAGEALAAIDEGDYWKAAERVGQAITPGAALGAGVAVPEKLAPEQDTAVPRILQQAEIAKPLLDLGLGLITAQGVLGGLAKTVPAVAKAVGAGFTADMLTNALDQYPVAKQTIAQYGWTDPRSLEAIVGVVSSGAFGLLGLKHAAFPGKPALTDVYRGKVPKVPVLGGGLDVTAAAKPTIDPATGRPKPAVDAWGVPLTNIPSAEPPQATPAEPTPSWFNRLLGRVPAPPVAPEQPPQTWSAEVPRSGMPSDILRPPEEVMQDQLVAAGRPNDPGQQLGEFQPAPIEEGVGVWPEVPAGGPLDVTAAVKPESVPKVPSVPEPVPPKSAISEVDAKQAVLDQLKLQGAPDVATDEMAAEFEAQRKQQADAEEAAGITASEEVKAQELQRSIEEALQKPPAEPRLTINVRDKAAADAMDVTKIPTDELRKREVYFREQKMPLAGDKVRAELANREPGGPQYVAPGTEAKRPEPAQDLGIAADTGPSPLGPGEYQGEGPIPGYDKPLPPPATDLGERTTEAEGRTTKVGDHYTIADAHGTGPTVEAIAPRLERYARSIGEIINGIGKSLGMRPIFRGLSTEFDFNAVRLPDGTIRLSPATILDNAKARAENLHGLEPGTPEYDAKVRRETARLSAHESVHEIGHLAIEQEAARDPVLAAKLKEAPGSVEQLPEGLRYVSEKAAARAAEKLGEGPHGKAFRSSLAKILAKNRRSLHTAIGRLEASLVGDTELALQHLREAVDGSWEEHKASGGRGSDVGPDSGLLQSARREVGDDAEARARRERQGHADRLPVGGAGVGARPGEAVPERPGERRAASGAGTAVRGGEPERPGRVIPPVFDDNRGRFGPGLDRRAVSGGAGEGVQRPGGAGADSAPRAEPKVEPALSRRREDRPAAEPDAGVAAPPEPEFSRRREEPKSEPLAEDDYAGKYLARVITPAAAAKNLTTHLAAQSGESNVSVVRDPINSRYGGIRDDKPFVVGPVTPEQWLSRARAWIPDQEEWRAARDWYRQLRGRFEEVFGEGPEAVKNLIAWAQSQQNESPSGGMRNVRRAADLASGIDLRFPPGHEKAGQPMLAGMAHDKLIAAMLDAAKETGTAAKLSDFLDATFDRQTRSWVGNDPRGGVPTPIDVWAGRDRGFVDEQMIGYARKAGMKWADKLSVDGAVSAPGRYESGIKFYREIADYLNENNVDGGKWTPTEAQAVGWTAMRRMAGIPDEGPRDIISKNTRNLAFEAGAYGKGSEYAERFAGLTPEQQDRMNAIVGPRLIEEAASRSGVRVIQTTRGVGGYKEDSNANWDVRVFGSPEQVEDFARFLGLGAQQDSVVATRRMKSGKDPGWDFRFEQRPSGKALRSWWKTAQTKDPVFARGGFTVLSTPDGHLLRLFPGRPEDGRAFNRYLHHDVQMQDFLNTMEKPFGVQSVEHGPIRADNMWVGNDWSEGNGGKGYSDALKARGRRLDGFDDVARSIFDDAHATVTAEPGAVAEPVAQELPAYSRRREDVDRPPPTKEELASIGTRPETDELRKRREEVGRDQTDRWLDARGPIKRDEYRYSRRREDVAPLPADSPERAENFKRWFGDSKVVDESGAPKKLYHGTNIKMFPKAERKAGISVFEPKNGATWLSDNPEFATAYTGGGRRGNAKGGRAEGGVIYPVYARVENPIDMRDMKLSTHITLRKLAEKAGLDPEAFAARVTELNAPEIERYQKMAEKQGAAPMVPADEFGFSFTTPERKADPDFKSLQRTLDYKVAYGWFDFPAVVKAFREFGIDGLHWGEKAHVAGRWEKDPVRLVKPRVVEAETWAIFDPTQIKSATGNRGTFDAENPDIRYSKRREDQGPAPTFYSQLSRVVDKLPQAMSGRDMLRYLADSKREVKREEMVWTGLDDFLAKNAERKVTPAEVQDFLKQNAVEVKEVTKGGRLGERYAPELTRQIDDWTRKLRIAREDAANVYGEDRAKWPTEVKNEISTMSHQMSEAVRERDNAADLSASKFSQHQTPGGENYRELLLTLPKREPSRESQARLLEAREKYQASVEKITAARGERAKADARRESGFAMVALSKAERAAIDSAPDFHGGHFDEPNVLAHVRFNERTDAEGKRVLFLEEIQSDWAQKGRREGFEGKPDTSGWKVKELNDGTFAVFDQNGRLTGLGRQTEEAAMQEAISQATQRAVPRAPFVGDTKAWTELAMKRMVRYAAENGFDKVAWTTGEVQAARYDLSKHLSEIRYFPKDAEGPAVLKALDHDGNVVIDQMNVPPERLPDVIGKEAAERLLAQPIDENVDGSKYVLSGLDLKVGGEGMKGFYDQIIPQVAAKLGKKFGASVGKTALELSGLDAKDGQLPPPTGRWVTFDPKETSGIVGRFATQAEAKAAAKRDPRLDYEREREPLNVHSLDITPQMRESVVQEGQSLFSRRRTDNAERVPSPEERVREVSGEPELGRPMLPGEAHRVDTKVAALKGVAPTVKLSRDSPRTWKSLDPKIQTLLNRVLADPDSEQKFLDKVRTGRVNDIETMAMDALRKAHEEASQTSAQAIAQARANGTDEGPANLAYLRASFGKLTEAYANAARSDVEAGTKLARAMAARARVMSAAGRSAPDAFLTKIFREIPGVSNAQAAEMLRLFLEDPSRLPDALHAAMNPSTWSKFIEFWKSGLVSALGGQIANVTSNAGEQLFRLGETVTAGLVDRMLPGDRVRYSSEARAELEGGVSRLGYAFSRLGQQMKKIATMKPNEFNPDSPIEYQTGAIGQGGVAGRAIAKVIPGFHAGRAITMPLRTLSAMDGFFKDVGGDAEMAKLAHRQAVQELGRGATQRAIRARKAEIVSEILDPNHAGHLDILEAVAKAKLARTFQDPGRVVHAIQNLKRTLPPLDIVMPFLSTPGRILEMTRQRTPLGFVDALQAARSWRAAVEKGSDVETIARLRGETVDALARPLLGTALIATFALLAKSGAMTGGGPTDKKAKNLKRDINWQPYSFVFDQPDGSKFYLPFTRWLEPVSGLLGISADIGEFGDPSKASEYLDRGMALVKDNFLDKSWWTGVTDVVDAVQDPGSKGAAYGSRLVGSLIPNIVAKAAQAYDPVIRDVRPSAEGVEGIGERITKTVESRIPGLTQKLPERRSGTGEPIKRQGQGAVGAALRFASPVVPSTEAPGRKLEEVLISLDEVPSAPRKEMTLYGRKMKLTDSEYSVVQDYDQRASNYLREYIARSSWDSLSEEDQRKIVRSMYSRAGDMARAALLREPGFIQRLSARQ